MTIFKVTTRATPFLLVFGIEATLHIEFEVEALRVVVSSHLPIKQSLRNRLTDLEELDERRRVAAQHIEAIQRRRNIIFDKRNKKRALETRYDGNDVECTENGFPRQIRCRVARSPHCERGVS